MAVASTSTQLAESLSTSAGAVALVAMVLCLGCDGGSTTPGHTSGGAAATTVASMGGSTASGGATDGGAAAGGVSSAGTTGADGLVWRKANLTNYESYPDPNSEECLEYNGCTWAGQFAALDGVQPESWVMANNIAAVNSGDFPTYRLKQLRLRQDSLEIDVTVYDMCADTDCDGCCTANSADTGFLIDIEKYTMQRFGSGSGIVDWTCLDCD